MRQGKGSTKQVMEALDKANEVRIACAVYKRDINSGKRSPYEALVEVPYELLGLKVKDYLQSLERVGKKRAEAALRHTTIRGDSRLGELSKSRRQQLGRVIADLKGDSIEDAVESGLDIDIEVVIDYLRDEDVMSSEQVAKWLVVPEGSVLYMARNGLIPAGRLGNYWRFSKKALVQYLAGRNRGNGKTGLQMIRPLQGRINDITRRVERELVISRGRSVLNGSVEKTAA